MIINVSGVLLIVQSKIMIIYIDHTKCVQLNHYHTNINVLAQSKLPCDTVRYNIDCFTVSLHSPNGLPLGLCMGIVSGLSNGGNTQWSYKAAIHCDWENPNLYLDQPITKGQCQPTGGHAWFPRQSYCHQARIVQQSWCNTVLHTAQKCCAIRQQAITWANVDPDECRHMASLNHNILTLTNIPVIHCHRICPISPACNR